MVTTDPSPAKRQDDPTTEDGQRADDRTSDLNTATPTPDDVRKAVEQVDDDLESGEENPS